MIDNTIYLHVNGYTFSDYEFPIMIKVIVNIGKISTQDIDVIMDNYLINRIYQYDSRVTGFIQFHTCNIRLIC